MKFLLILMIINAFKIIKIIKIIKINAQKKIFINIYIINNLEKYKYYFNGYKKIRTKIFVNLSIKYIINIYEYLKILEIIL